MRRYTVEWLSSAEDSLARVWTAAVDRNAITEAAKAIDAVLERDPYSQSESRSGETRVMFVLPLGVLFKVDEARKLVSVWRVWRPRRRV